MINTISAQTRRMRGFKDVEGDIFDIMREHYSSEVFYSSLLSEDDIIYSENYIRAIDNGKIPQLDVVESFEGSAYGPDEYHHAIINGVCYKVYFKEV